MELIRPCIEFIFPSIKESGQEDLAVASLLTPVLPNRSPLALEVISSIRKQRRAGLSADPLCNLFSVCTL